MSEEKIEIKKSELEDLIQEKVKEELNKKQETEKDTSNSQDENVSRREFLKKASLGAVGLGALGLTPGSALQIKSDDLNVLTSNDGGSTLTEGLTVDGNQNVDVPNGQLTEQSNRVATRTWTNNNADVSNADTVDGEHASAFADVSHNHDGRYVRLFNGVQAPVYASKSDVPSGITEGELVFIEGDGLYVEDGT